MTMGGCFLQIQGIRKAYGSVTALDDCSLEIHRGEFVTLLGPSGCGKTTTLRMVAGFVRPDGGTIRIGDRVLSSDGVFVPPEKRGIGMVFQSYAVWPHMSVRANVELPLRLRGIGRAEARHQASEVLELCRLGKLADRDPHQLSGGQLQRVALARALVYKPELVLLDEPLSNLDVALREELRHELHLLHKAMGATFVLVTHDQVEAMSLSDRVVVMRDGRIEQVGAPQEIYRSPRTDFVAQFVGAANLLEGRIEDIVRTGDRVRCAVRVKDLILHVRGWDGARTGAAVTLAVHPEAVRLGEAATATANSGDNQYEGVVRAAYFLGRTQEAVVDIGGVELRAVQVRGRTFVEGERIPLSVAVDSVIAIGVSSASTSPSEKVRDETLGTPGLFAAGTAGAAQRERA
jgi:ABC-type Fe3+/spermidine/putrescine transport system ATPase subunit